MYDSSGATAAGNAGAGAGLAAYQGMSPTQFSQMNMQGPQQAQAAQFNPVSQNAYSSIQTNPQLTQAQMAQLGALQQLQQQGGMTAQSQANLNQVQQQANQNAQSQNAAIMQNAAMRGTQNSGNSLLAQLVAQQGATNQQNANNMQIAGQAQNTALQAGQGAANLAGQMQNTSYQQQAQQAAAQNSINQFNAQGGLGASEFNSQQQQGVLNAQAQAANQNQMYNNYLMPNTDFQQNAQIAQGLGQTGMGVGNYYNQQNQLNKQLMGGILGGATQIGTASMGSGGGEAADAAWGGKIPGQASVPGNSFANDTVPTMTSPGEVVVPRSLTNKNPLAIGNFVKNAAPTTSPDKNKEAMLSALKHIRQKGGV